MQASPAPAIEARNLYFSLSNKQGKLVSILKNCSIRVPPGQLWMLLGPNVCGKSTLLKVLAGFLRPDDGIVSVKKPNSFVFRNPDHQDASCILQMLKRLNGDSFISFAVESMIGLYEKSQ